MALVLKSPNALALAAGAHTSVAAADTLNTGLREVHYVSVSYASDLIAAATNVTATIANQTSSPGVITLSTWKPTGGADSAPIPATTFGRVIHWIAFGR